MTSDRLSQHAPITSTKGVYPSNKKFACRLFASGRIRHVGTYATVEECALAYDSAVYHVRFPESGRFPVFNNPEHSADNPPPLLPDVARLKAKISEESLLNAPTSPRAVFVARDKAACTSLVLTALAGMEASRQSIGRAREELDTQQALLRLQARNLAEFTSDPGHRLKLACFAGCAVEELPACRNPEPETPADATHA